MSTKQRIIELESKLDGLKNDARYHDLRRTYGDHSPEVLSHLESCAATQAARYTSDTAQRSGPWARRSRD